MPLMGNTVGIIENKWGKKCILDPFSVDKCVLVLPALNAAWLIFIVRLFMFWLTGQSDGAGGRAVSYARSKWSAEETHR